MKRIATQLVSLTSLGLLTFGFASACASEQSAFNGNANNGTDASVGAVGVGGGGGAGGGGAAGAPEPPSCASNPPSASYCPASPNGMGVACCISSLGICGIDLGMGCGTAPTMPTPYGG